MPKILFHLRDVPDDEAQEVRALLDEHDIGYYETSAGILGISVPALWVKTAEDFSRGRHLLDDYQQQRARRVRAAYDAARQQGEGRGLWQSFRERPLRFGGHLALIGLILYLSLKLFVGW